MDKIILRGLPVDCVIGTLPAERVSPQRLYFDLILSGELLVRIGEHVEHTAVERTVLEYAAGTRFQLLERLAYACAERLLERFPLLGSVTLRIRKPDAPVVSESVELEITRGRS